jgi:TRAP-type mannitol/chloroaromatic compound transport system permease large subunit
VLLILYGATAGVSVVQLYAGALFPGMMLAGLYILYVVILAKLKPHLAPLPPKEELHVALPERTLPIAGGEHRRALPRLVRALSNPPAGVSRGYVLKQLAVALFPAVSVIVLFAVIHNAATRPSEDANPAGLTAVDASGRSAGVGEPPGAGVQEPPGARTGVQEPPGAGVQEPPGAGVQEPPGAGVQEPPGAGVQEPPGAGVQEPPGGGMQDPPGGGVQEPPGDGVQEPPGGGVQEPPGAEAPKPATGSDAGSATAAGVQPPPAAVAEPPKSDAKPTATGTATGSTPDAHSAGKAGASKPAPPTFWIALLIALVLLGIFYSIFTFERLEVLKMLSTSFFPLTMLILSVLGSIIFGWATPTEAAAVGAAGAMILTAAYRQFTWRVVKESVFLTAKTSAMVCWLFIGSSIFSAAFALLGGQGLIESWVLGMDLSPFQFMLLAQVIIFLLGWPLEWTEIIVIFMPIFIPLLDNFGIDPLFFGLLVALNLQTAFLSPPVAMAAFYLKGVSPPHVSLNQIFAGMMPFMAIQVVAIILLYLFPGIGLWLPTVLYR